MPAFFRMSGSRPPAAKSFPAPSRRTRPSLELLEGRTVPTVLRTITYDQITAMPSDARVDPVGYDAISADGSRGVFFTDTNTGNAVYTIKTDGTGLTLIDSGPFGYGGGFRISADGSVVMTTHAAQAAPLELLVANSDGTNLHDAVPASLGVPGGSPNCLAPDGRTVFFATATHGMWGPSNPPEYVPGVYAMFADGTGSPQLLVSVHQVALLEGVPDTDVNLGSTNGDDFNMAVSSHGTRMVFGASHASGEFLLGVKLSGSGGAVTADPASLHRIGIDNVPFALYAAAISGDGTKVVRNDFVNNRPVVTVFNFDGSNPVQLNGVPDNYESLAGRAPIQLTQDGSKVLLGTTSLLINSDNSGILQIGTNVGLDTSGPPNHNLVHSGLYNATMSGDAKTFLYISNDVNGPFQLATAKLNPSSLGKAPAVTDVSVSPGFVVTNGKSNYAVSAHVASGDPIAGASGALLLGEVTENGAKLTDGRIFDDGQNGGDSKAGDGLYTNNFFAYNYDGPLGPRTVRVSAETVDAAGLQHVTSVEVDGLSVVDTAPVTTTMAFTTATYTISETGGSVTIGVNRTGNTSGTATVHYATSDGTAEAGDDYTATSGDLTFAPGVIAQSFTVPIINSGFSGDARTVNLALSNPTGTGTDLGAPSTATLSINPGSPPPFGGRLFAIGQNDGSVRILDPQTGLDLCPLFRPFDVGGSKYTGLVEVAVGDMNGDGTADLLVAAANPAGTFGLDPSKAGQVFMYDGRSFAADETPTFTVAVIIPFASTDSVESRAGIIPADSPYVNGLNIAVGDVDGNGTLDIVAGTRGGTATSGHREIGRMVVIDGPTGGSIGGVQHPFGDAYQKGVVVAAGNFDGVGGAEIAVTRGGPVASTNRSTQAVKLKVFQLAGGNLSQLNLTGQTDTEGNPVPFAPFGSVTNDDGAVIQRDARVTAVDQDGDGKQELVFTALDDVTDPANKRVRVALFSLSATGGAMLVSTGPAGSVPSDYLLPTTVVDHAIAPVNLNGDAASDLAVVVQLPSGAKRGHAMYLDPMTGNDTGGGFDFNIITGGISVGGV